MNDTVILFYTKFNTTKKYAIALSNQLCCDIYNVVDFEFSDIKLYKNLIICSPIYAGNIEILKFLNKYAHFLKDINIVYVINSLNQNTVNAQQTLVKNAKIFYKKGGIQKHWTFFHIANICKNVIYYQKYPYLINTFVSKQNFEIESVEDVVFYCRNTLKIPTPKALKD